MASGIFDDALIKHLWSSDECRAIFSDENRVRKWYEFEAALAIEQAAMGMVMLLAELDLDRARKAQIDQLFATLKDDNAFDRARFARVLEQLDRGSGR